MGWCDHRVPPLSCISKGSYCTDAAGSKPCCADIQTPHRFVKTCLHKNSHPVCPLVTGCSSATQLPTACHCVSKLALLCTVHSSTRKAERECLELKLEVSEVCTARISLQRSRPFLSKPKVSSECVSRTSPHLAGSLLAASAAEMCCSFLGSTVTGSSLQLALMLCRSSQRFTCLGSQRGADLAG